MPSCQNNYTEKKIKQTPSGYSLFTNCSFDETKSKLDCYKGEGCTERFCKDLREHTVKIISFEEKEMIPLTDKENNFYEKQKFVTSARKNLVQIKMIKMDLNYTVKSEIIVMTQENLEELLLVFAI